MSAYTEAVDSYLDGIEAVSPGGVRAWTLHGAELVHGTCCVDCLMYLANGDEPDEREQ